MEAEYIATFYTHYDAIIFSRQLKAAGVESQLMPVPRALSSSCGTCARFRCAKADIARFSLTGTEQLVRVTADGYEMIRDNRHS